MFGFNELAVDGVVDEGEEIVVKSGDIKEAERFHMEAELAPGEDFAEFLESSETAGEGDEAVGEFSHEGFAFVHGIDDAEVGEFDFSEFFFDEELGDDADDFAAVVDDGIGDAAHESDVASAVDEFNAFTDEQFAKSVGSLDVRGIGTEAGATKDGDAFHATPVYQ